MSVDSADAPPPPPPPPPPDYSVADEPVSGEDSEPPEGAYQQQADTAVSNGSGALDGLSELPAADVPVVDEGQAAPDLVTDTDTGIDGTTEDSMLADTQTPDQVQERRIWEASGGTGHDLPDSIREDLGQLGQDLRSDIDPDVWAAKPDQRAEMLAGANDRIREAYGLPPGELSYSELPDGQTGYFDPDTGTIMLNSSLLKDSNPDEAINTVSHENFHAYQQEAIDGNAIDPYAESRVTAWGIGSDNYDLIDYMDNPLEVDAFAAERAVIEGYRR